MDDDDTVMRKALAAYFRSGATEQPSATASAVEAVDGLRYAVLRNVRGVLKVYRVRLDGMLKGLKRWPSELDKGTAFKDSEVGAVSMINPLKIIEHLLKLDRPLTPAERKKVDRHFKLALEAARQLERIADEAMAAVRRPHQAKP
jgi:hypothetical protein